MRLSSLRAALIVLAMVAQTVAGGAGMAHAAAGPAQRQTIAHHCEHMTPQDDGAPAEQSHKRGMCDSCLVCDGPPAATFVHRAHFALAQIDFAAAEFPPPTSDRPAARATQVQRARAPPGAA